MFLLTGLSALALIYRESASVEECVFEAVSACCNVGFSAGLTRRLSPEGEVLVILAMILGRVMPLAVLAKHLRMLSGQPAACSTATGPPAASARC